MRLEFINDKNKRNFNNAITGIAGIENVELKHIVFNAEEIQILQKARAICDKAETLLVESKECEPGEQNDYGLAEIYLQNIIDDNK